MPSKFKTDPFGQKHVSVLLMVAHRELQFRLTQGVDAKDIGGKGKLI